MTAAEVNIAVAVFAAHVLEMHGDGVALFLALCVPSQDAFERGKVRHFPFSHKRKLWKQTICLFSFSLYDSPVNTDNNFLCNDP